MSTTIAAGEGDTQRSTETSIAAAALQTRPHTGAVKAVILDLLRRFGPMTDEQLVERYEHHRTTADDVPPVTPQSIRTRRHELTAEGAVADSGQESRTRLANRAKVWALAENRLHL